MARVLVSLEDARAVVADVSQYGGSFSFLELLSSGGNVRSWRISCDASWTISLGDLTAKLDHFFMAEP